MQKVRLGDVCKLNMGQSPDSSSYNENKEGIPFFQGNADFGEVYPNLRVWCRCPIKIAKIGDILISVRAPIGALNMANIECCIGRGLAALTVNEKICNKKYFWYCIKSQVEELKSKGTGSTFKAISKEALSETILPIYPLEQQQQIVSVLDKISLLIDKRKKQLKKLDELVKSRFVEMFGDPVENDKGWQHQAIDKVAPSSAWAGDNSERVWLLNLDMVEAQTGRIIDCLYIEKEQVGTSTHGFDEGNVLYSKLRPYLNKVVVPTKKGYCTTELVPLRPNAMLNRQFLANLLRSEAFVSFIKEKVVGAKMPRVSMDVFREFECILPPLELQEQFAAFVEQIEKVKLHVQKSLQKLETLKKALMQKYFG